MRFAQQSAPPPDLRIVRVDSVHPHEVHDSQRTMPLIDRMRQEAYMINPPIVAPISATQFVVLDGANRCYAFSELNYPHILVQVATYDSGYVELKTWQHIVSRWDGDTFLKKLQQLEEVRVNSGQDNAAIAHILLKDGRVFALCSPVDTTHERNAVLRKIVKVYHDNASLHRTAISEPDEIWPLYPEAFALVMFPQYRPADIIGAAKYRAYLPPGVSRHIIHGRAVRVNYPMDVLRDKTTKLFEKNETLASWVQDRLQNRKVRYYAEATYQFDE